MKAKDYELMRRILLEVGSNLINNEEDQEDNEAGWWEEIQWEIERVEQMLNEELTRRYAEEGDSVESGGRTYTGD